MLLVLRYTSKLVHPAHTTYSFWYGYNSTTSPFCRDHSVGPSPAEEAITHTGQYKLIVSARTAHVHRYYYAATTPPSFMSIQISSYLPLLRVITWASAVRLDQHHLLKHVIYSNSQHTVICSCFLYNLYKFVLVFCYIVYFTAINSCRYAMEFAQLLTPCCPLQFFT